MSEEISPETEAALRELAGKAVEFLRALAKFSEAECERLETLIREIAPGLDEEFGYWPM